MTDSNQINELTGEEIDLVAGGNGGLASSGGFAPPPPTDSLYAGAGN